MLKNIKNSISYIHNIGIHSELSADLIAKVRMINTIVLIGIAINTLFLCLALFVYQSEPKVIGLIVSVIFIEGLVLVLNAFFSPKVSFYYIITSLTLIFTGLKIFYINNWGEQFMFLIIIYLVFLLFNGQKKQFFLVFIITLFFFIAEIVHQFLPEKMITSFFNTRDTRLYLFIVYVIWLVFLINLFHRRTMEAREEQGKLLLKLQQKNQEIQQVSSEVERFNHIASHDLKSPLRNIISFIGLTKIKLKREQYEDIPEQLDFIENASEQMNALIDDILTFSGIDETNSQITEIDVNELTSDVILDLDEFLQKRNGQIIFNILPSILTNRKTLKMVFQNFIKNAILYNESVQPTVKITYHVDSQHHIFNFEDNGIGIPKEFQGQVFEYFKRLHTYDTYKGTGLGLGICKKIIEKMGGQLSLISEVKKGSTFTVQLPLNDI